MISQLNTASTYKAYDSSSITTPKPNATIQKKDDGTTKVQQLQEQIASGSYTIDLNKLAHKMAEDLL